jgi:hypothetical protein
MIGKMNISTINFDINSVFFRIEEIIKYKLIPTRERGFEQSSSARHGDAYALP